MEDVLDKKGCEFECLIYGDNAIGTIQIGQWDGKPSAFLCQNTRSGSTSGKSKFGYMYEWCVKSGNTAHLKENNVTQFKLINKIDTYELW